MKAARERERERERAIYDYKLPPAVISVVVGSNGNSEEQASSVPLISHITTQHFRSGGLDRSQTSEKIETFHAKNSNRVLTDLNY